MELNQIKMTVEFSLESTDEILRAANLAYVLNGEATKDGREEQMIRDGLSRLEVAISDFEKLQKCNKMLEHLADYFSDELKAVIICNGVERKDFVAICNRPELYVRHDMVLKFVAIED